MIRLLLKLLPAKVSPAVRAEQVRLLYHQGSTGLTLGMITAVVGVVMLWRVADHTKLLLWLSAMAAITAVRGGLIVRFLAAPMEDRVLDKWADSYVMWTLAGGTLWGTLAFFYDPAWPPAHQVTLFIIFTGITAGAFNSTSSVFVAFLVYSMPPSICLMVVTLRQSEQLFYELAALFAAYIVSMYVSALKFHNSMTRSLAIRFENERLSTELAHKNQKLKDLAERDELTGIANRRAMDKFLASEWNRHYRSQQPLSLLFVDLDYFKQYNDTYGHEGGDGCLTEAAAILACNAHRSTDMAARFGGEEFAIILPETAAVDALRVAERIRADLAAARIAHAGSPIAPFLTMSIGVATAVPQRLDDGDWLKTAADQALYKAKQDGRDRVVVANQATLWRQPALVRHAGKQ